MDTPSRAQARDLLPRLLALALLLCHFHVSSVQLQARPGSPLPVRLPVHWQLLHSPPPLPPPPHSERPPLLPLPLPGRHMVQVVKHLERRQLD